MQAFNNVHNATPSGSGNKGLLPGVNIEVGLSRFYPFAERASHIVGYVAPPAINDLTGDPIMELLRSVARAEERVRGIVEVRDRHRILHGALRPVVEGGQDAVAALAAVLPVLE